MLVRFAIRSDRPLSPPVLLGLPRPPSVRRVWQVADPLGRVGVALLSACVLLAGAGIASAADAASVRILSSKPPKDGDVVRGQVAVEASNLRAAADALREGLEASEECRGLLAKGGTQEPLLKMAPSDQTCTLENLHETLIEQRRAFAMLKKWVGACSKHGCPGSTEETKAEAEAFKPEIERLQDRLYRLMDAEGLREPIAAELVSGLVFGTPPAGTEADTSRLPAAHIRWQTRPIQFDYDIDRLWQATFSGRFGYLPALALVQPVAPAGSAPDSAFATAANGAADGDPQPELAYQEALGWDVKANSQWTLGEGWQLQLNYGVGQSILNSESSLGQIEGRDAVLITVPNGVGRAAFFHGGEASIRFFRANRALRAEQQSWNPALEIAVGLREDSRFRQDETTGFLDYERPERRYTFRLLLSDLRVVDRRTKEQAPAFTLSFGVEHEWGRRDGLPAVTRIFLVGDLPFLQAFRGRR